MSRSRAKKAKRMPTSPGGKKYASRRARRKGDVPEGGGFKKVSSSYDINDGGKARPVRPSDPRSRK